MNLTKRIPLLRPGIILLLIVLLPVFVWAVATQRIELRKKASEPAAVCWNRVIAQTSDASSGAQTLNWPDGCKGNVSSDAVCTQALVPLTSDEILQYNSWVSSGRPAISGCGPTPTPAPTNTPTPTGTPTPTPTPGPTSTPTPSTSFQINWTTPYAYLQASDMIITANGKTFKANPATNLQLHSNPPNTPDYMTLEATWTENNVEMRMFIYFNADTVTTGTPYRRWWVNEVRTYNGNASGDWIYYRRAQLSGLAIMGMGYPFVANDLVLTSSEGGVGEIKFKNLWLRAFMNENPYTTPTPTPTVIIPTQTGCVKSPVYTDDRCVAYRRVTSLESSSACYSYEQCGPMQGNGTCVKSPTYNGDLCNGYRVMPGISRSCDTYEQCQYANLTPTPRPILPGDLNGDGTVNILDYNILLTNYGKTGTPGFTPADINRDGTVNLLDYNLLLQYYGSNGYRPD